MIQISSQFSAMIIAREGELAVRWVEAIPSTLNDLFKAWNLQQDGAALYGMCAVVLPVRTPNGDRHVLKLGWIDEETRAEAPALRAWAGRGAVSMTRFDETSGAMLLERLDERRVLIDVPIDNALNIAAGILRELRVPSVTGLRKASDSAKRWKTEFLDDWERLAKPCSETVLNFAVQLCAELEKPTEDAWILHGDYHYANILGRSEESWAVIDPMALAGDPAYEVVPLLRNRWEEIRGDGSNNAAVVQRLERFADLAEIDLLTTYQWCLVRSVDDAMWFQENGYIDRAEISWNIVESMFKCL